MVKLASLYLLLVVYIKRRYFISAQKARFLRKQSGARLSAVGPPQGARAPLGGSGARPAHSVGAAILMALIIVAIAATMAATMLARQQASLVGEEARRHATQARWILRGAMDWVRLVLREDLRFNAVDHLGEAWAVPLKPISLKAFLAVDQRADDAVFEALLQCKIDDAQAKFNLRNLAEDNTQPSTTQTAALIKLLTALGLSSKAKDLANEASANVLLLVQGALFEPRSAMDLMTSLTSEERTKLSPYITLLPRPTLVNCNTASAEVLQAVIPDLDLSQAKSIVERRAGAYFTTTQQLTQQIQAYKPKGAPPISTTTNYFEVTGVVLWDALTIEQHALVERKGGLGGNNITVDVVQISYGPTMPEKAP
jgi:general secretion pathway protein K